MGTHRRYVALDETQTLFDTHFPVSVVVANYSNDPRDTRRQYLGTKRMSTSDIMTPPEGSFAYGVINSDLFNKARRVYGEPRTGAEMGWNGNFYNFRVHADLILALLEHIGFTPATDVVFVDAFGNCAHLRKELMDDWNRLHNIEVPKSSLICQSGSDMRLPIVRSAHRNARRLYDRLKFPEQYAGDDRTYSDSKISFTDEDMIRIHLARLTRHERREANRLLADLSVTSEMPEYIPA